MIIAANFSSALLSLAIQISTDSSSLTNKTFMWVYNTLFRDRAFNPRNEPLVSLEKSNSGVYSPLCRCRDLNATPFRPCWRKDKELILKVFKFDVTVKRSQGTLDINTCTSILVYANMRYTFLYL